ncbi:MAG: hypothetical protein ABH804_03035 [archaeon]
MKKKGVEIKRMISVIESSNEGAIKLLKKFKTKQIKKGYSGRGGEKYLVFYRRI